MKRSQIILFTVFIVITGFIYLTLMSNRKEDSKKLKSEDSTVFVPVREVKNRIRQMSITSYGQITPNTELIVSFEVQGELLKRSNGALKPGSKFKKGDVLYQLDNSEAYWSLSSRKTALNNILLNCMPDIEIEFPDETKKWIDYLAELKPKLLLPELPQMSPKERMFLTTRNFLTEYYNIKSAEARMQKYNWIAPFSGTVVEVYAEPGSVVNPGAQVAKIAEIGDYEVKVPIGLDELEIYSSQNSALFTDANGKEIGAGKILRISDVINQQTQSADVYYSIKPLKDTKIYHGLFVNVSINQKAEKETMALPRVAVNDNQVRILDEGKLVKQSILIVGSKPDTVFVTGLNNGQFVLLEQVEEKEDKVKYEGVER